MRFALEAAESDPLAGMENDDCVRLVERILESDEFRNAHRLRELLAFLARETLEGRGDEIHEQLIGCSVFEREPGYSSNDDNIVRVQARRLRLKLGAYFSGEGADEPLLLTIPKGSYVPVFSHRPETEVGVELPDRSATQDNSSNRPPWSSMKWVALAWTIPVLLIATWWIVSQDSAQRPVARLPPGDQHPLFSYLFDSRHPTSIVVADSTLETLLYISGGKLSLDEYIRRDYGSLYRGLSPERHSVMEIVAKRQATSIVDSVVAASFLRLSGESGPRVSIKFARDLQLRTLKAGHVILLGSERSNPWVGLFEPLMNFSIKYDDGHVVYNRSPQPGEHASYRGESDQGSEVGYSVVALLPNLSRNGNVLIVAGTKMTSTEAAGEFIANPARAAGFLKILSESTDNGEGKRHGAIESPPYFEALLRTTATGGVARESKVVSYRIWHPQTAGGESAKP